jgi:beta-lactamase regulating signal transducer with metallopeptidase domain
VLNPCCWQVHRANILLPAYVLDLPEPQQRAIVKHELGHLQAGHPLHLFIQRICLALFWFHPLVRFSARRADLARELHCDRVSISHRREAVAYLSSLLSLTQASDSLQRKGFVLPFVTRRNHDLQRRITAITDRDWSCGANDRRKRKLLPALIYASAAIVWLLWLPVDADSSARSTWSPWPTHTANSIKTIIDYPLRDYELDGHRLTERLRHK